jgi:hypothetical protein
MLLGSAAVAEGEEEDEGRLVDFAFVAVVDAPGFLGEDDGCLSAEVAGFVGRFAAEATFALAEGAGTRLGSGFIAGFAAGFFAGAEEVGEAEGFFAAVGEGFGARAASSFGRGEGNAIERENLS